MRGGGFVVVVVVGTDGVVEPVLGEAEADVDVDVLGSDLRVRGYSGLASSSPFVIERESGVGTGDGRRGLTGSPSMLLTSSTFTFNGDLDRGSSRVIEDVEASGEGYSFSDLIAIVRNLDMGLKDSAEDNEQGRALVGLGNKRGYPL